MRIRRGFTIIEVLVVIAITAVVFGLVLDALIHTERASSALVLHEQMRQEALVISSSVEKALRQGMYDEQLPAGGAADTPAAGGNPATQIPESLSVTGMTTAVLAVTTPASAPTSPTRETPRPAIRPTISQTPATTVPASVRNLLTTSSLPATSGQPVTTGTTSRFELNRLQLSTLGFGQKNGILHEITNEGVPGNHHIVLRQENGATRKLGAMADRLQADITFRYAETFNGLDAAWVPVASRPRLVEYTVRVWPAGKKHLTFDTAIADDGRRERFSMTSAVALP